jgi:hypothetical protein
MYKNLEVVRLAYLLDKFHDGIHRAYASLFDE